MSTATPSVTTTELLALPDDGIDRELIRGQLRERPMTRRNRKHAATEANITRLLGNWVAEHPDLQLRLLSGEVGTILASNPDTTVGIDVGVFPLGLLHGDSSDTNLVRGVPCLAVEILSPSDKHEEIHEKIVEYLRVGVSLVWEVDPDFQTIRVYRPGNEPQMFNRRQTISNEEVLLGFAANVAEFFPDWSTL